MSEYFVFYDICVSNKLFNITSQICLLEILNMVKNAITGKSSMISGYVSLKSVAGSWITSVPQLQSISQRGKSCFTKQLWKPSFSPMFSDGTFLTRLENMDLIYRHAQHSQLQMKFEHMKYSTVLVLQRKSSSASLIRHPYLWELLLAWSCCVLVPHT